MRAVPGGWDEAQRRLRARAQDQAALLVPRPGCPIYGLSAPALGPARVTQYSSFNGKWTSVTLSYGEPDAPAGPRVTVTTEARDGGMVARSRPDSPPAAESRQEVDNVTVTVATWGVAMDAARIAPVRDVRQVIEASLAEIIELIERRRREPDGPGPQLPALLGPRAWTAYWSAHATSPLQGEVAPRGYRARWS
jgi:hypothetical protein